MGKTITTYLINGDPKGARQVFISNRVCKMMVIPRSELSIIDEREELTTPSFYILLGQADDGTPKAYIGQTENFTERVKQHDYKKTFWNVAIVFISIGGAMNKADVEYLEHKGYELASEVKRYNLDENKQAPKEPHLPEHQRDAMDEYFEDCKLLVSFIGCNLFEKEKSEEDKDAIVFHLTRKKCYAKGIYSSEGMTVLHDSHVIKDNSASFKSGTNRNKWLQKNTYDKDGELYLKQDVTFPSPSTAAQFCLGCNSNGWTDWRTKDGKTLDSIFRNVKGEGDK